MPIICAIYLKDMIHYKRHEKASSYYLYIYIYIICMKGDLVAFHIFRQEVLLPMNILEALYYLLRDSVVQHLPFGTELLTLGFQLLDLNCLQFNGHPLPSHLSILLLELRFHGGPWEPESNDCSLDFVLLLHVTSAIDPNALVLLEVWWDTAENTRVDLSAVTSGTC